MATSAARAITGEREPVDVRIEMALLRCCRRALFIARTVVGRINCSSLNAVSPVRATLLVAGARGIILWHGLYARPSERLGVHSGLRRREEKPDAQLAVAARGGRM